MVDKCLCPSPPPRHALFKDILLQPHCHCSLFRKCTLKLKVKGYDIATYSQMIWKKVCDPSLHIIINVAKY